MRKIAVYLYKNPFLLIALFTAIAYLPVLLPFFYIKNDFVTQMLPLRFFVSESLQSGYMPWWNPYVNFGIPQYGDMNGAFWNPIVWIISLSTGYNIWTFTLELLFYIFLSGWGMYLLLKNLKLQKNISLVGSFSYLSCGYIVGHLQHTSWITGAAFFPFVLLYFIRINQQPNFKNLLYGSLSVFMLLSSAHPGIIIGGGYFFLLFITALFFIKGKDLIKKIHPAFLKSNFLFLVTSLLLSIGIIVGYSDVLPYITRGEVISQMEEPTTLQSGISLLYPLAVHKSSFFHTDISMRNMHIGIALLAGFIVFFKLANRKTAVSIFFIFLFFLLLSAGGIVGTIAGKIFPGIGYVRLIGEFSLFTAITMILTGSYGWHLFIQQKKNDRAEIKLMNGLQYLFAATAISCFILILITHDSILYHTIQSEYSGFSNIIKSALDHITISDLFFVQSCLSLVFILWYKKSIGGQSFIKYGIIAAYLAIVCWLCLPFTGLGSKSKREINNILLAAPKGISIQPLKVANKAAYIDSSNFILAGLPNVYSKQIAPPSSKEYPINLKSNANFVGDAQRMQFIEKQAYLFLSKDTTLLTATNSDSNHIHIKKSTPCLIEAEITNEVFNYLTFTQSNYPYWEAYINNKPVPNFSGFGSLLTIQIPKGKSVIRFEFYPRKVATAAYISFGLLLIVFITLIVLEIKSIPKNKTV